MFRPGIKPTVGRLLSRMVQPARLSSHPPRVDMYAKKTPDRGLTDQDVQDWEYWEIRPAHIPEWTYADPIVEGAPFESRWTRIGISFAWFWMLYHIYHEWPVLFGEIVVPDPKMFTDRELGIPPDE